ncbi:copper-translocating P-type ATPase [Candidatus Campbellbacteria bacterium CG22_combo_CG10-13_8_21_14_all_36_13]|uniref:Copper-translocating P-type ATPase n=1 Tax=Candidatus Campbellbacteria bacterium CG22_combo_CG10-13_8_21_14_all_36_13 TaxID=1974529 RepID=A0A2H0DYN9_9BACT|nr:MAG: copper-translocating P-type ATPase [Candidatus Campbellbacteria bacterium CG22_combo_CG10-13_8_21_14_all_36_13]
MKDCCHSEKKIEYNHHEGCGMKDHSDMSGHNMHNHGSHASSMMMHGSPKDFLRRFWIVTIFLIPLILTNANVAELLGFGPFALGKWIQFAIATIIFGFSLVFFEHASHEIKARKYGMMTLVSLAVGAGYLFSVASTFISSINAEFYLEISTLIWVLLFGHYLEAKSSVSAGDALQEVAKLLPKQAHRLVSDKEEDVDINDLKEDDIVRVKPGEKIPADGIIQEGGANIDESLISGESKPIQKSKGDEVVAGSICLDGSITVILKRVGENSTIGQIKQLIKEAQGTKPNSQKIADKASAILTFVAGITAVLTIIVWYFLLGHTFVFAVTLAITVLVIACPHALGLAIPTVTTITTSLALKNGIFIKNLGKIEVIKKADYVVFDKTGTLTEGKFAVREVVVTTDDVSVEKVLFVASSIEKYSSHIIGHAVVEYSDDRSITTENFENIKNFSGRGITGEYDGIAYAVGNRLLMNDLSVSDEDSEKSAQDLENRGETVVYVSDDKKIIGLIALSDAIKKESKEAIEKLHEIGIKVAMLTGDNKVVAGDVAKDLGIDTYFAEVLPEDKYRHIKDLQEKGNVVLMVGDGVNDAPALTQANVGIAIGAGTDVAVEAGDVVLMKNSPKDVVGLIILARKVYSKMIQNLVWALGYNVVAIPAAAGVFAFAGFFLRPEIGAFVMSLSTVIVVVNAMSLKRVKLV